MMSEPDFVTPVLRDRTPLRVRTYEQDASLGERYVSSSPHAAAVVESVHTAVLNRERASATNPPLRSAGATVGEPDTSEAVAADRLVIDTESDPAYRHGMEGHGSDKDTFGRGGASFRDSGEGVPAGAPVTAPGKAAHESSRRARLSRWQEQR